MDGSDARAPTMVAAMRHAHEHILRPTWPFSSPACPLPRLVFKGQASSTLIYDKRKYSCRFHGVGLCASGR